MRSRAASAAGLGAACCLLAACGSSSRYQVRAKVQEFAVAVEHKDAKKICTDVFAPSLVRRFKSVGVSCEQGLKIFFSGLNNPTLAVGKVTVHGAHASAVTLSGAKGQRTTMRTVELAKASNGWRIAGLGAPVGSSGATGGGTTTGSKTSTARTAPSKTTKSKPAPTKPGSTKTKSNPKSKTP